MLTWEGTESDFELNGVYRMNSAVADWPPIEFEKEAHRLAREDERGKLLSACQRDIVHEQGFDETGGPTCQCGELAHPLIIIHSATRAMKLYASATVRHERQELAKEIERLAGLGASGDFIASHIRKMT